MKGSLHQLLAVRKDEATRTNEIADETKKVLGNAHLFTGSVRSYEPFKIDESNKEFVREEDEQVVLSYTVGEKLKWFAEEYARLVDIEYQIDCTNQATVADVEVDDLHINDVPATFLLDLIGLLDRVRKVYSKIQVLNPTSTWILDTDAGDGVYRAEHDEVRYRTEKVLKHKVLVKATDKHPAQVEKWPEDERIGKYTKRIWAGAITAYEKSQLLGRVDSLIRATKKALATANEAEHARGKIADEIFTWLHQGIASGGVARKGDGG